MNEFKVKLYHISTDYVFNNKNKEIKKTVVTKTKSSKLKNTALSILQKLYDENQDKLFYVTKLIDANSYQYIKSTPIDILYEDMDKYINGEGDEK